MSTAKRRVRHRTRRVVARPGPSSAAAVGTDPPASPSGVEERGRRSIQMSLSGRTVVVPASSRPGGKRCRVSPTDAAGTIDLARGRSRIALVHSSATAGRLCETKTSGTPRARSSRMRDDAPLLELRVADAEDFVDDQHVRVEVRRDREAEPRVHPRRVALDRRVDELADAGEVDDLVELARRSRRASCP